jgi:hypothetical protein
MTICSEYIKFNTFTATTIYKRIYKRTNNGLLKMQAQSMLGLLEPGVIFLIQ